MLIEVRHLYLAHHLYLRRPGPFPYVDRDGKALRRVATPSAPISPSRCLFPAGNRHQSCLEESLLAEGDTNRKGHLHLRGLIRAPGMLLCSFRRSIHGLLRDNQHQTLSPSIVTTSRGAHVLSAQDQTAPKVALVTCSLSEDTRGSPLFPTHNCVAPNVLVASEVQQPKAPSPGHAWNRVQ